MRPRDAKREGLVRLRIPAHPNPPPGARKVLLVRTSGLRRSPTRNGRSLRLGQQVFSAGLAKGAERRFGGEFFGSKLFQPARGVFGSAKQSPVLMEVPGHLFFRTQLRSKGHLDFARTFRRVVGELSRGRAARNAIQ